MSAESMLSLPPNSRGVDPSLLRDGPLRRTARRLILQALQALRNDRLVVREGERRWEFGPAGSAAEPVVVDVHSPRLYTRILGEGSLGAAAAWIDGDWDCSDLPGLLRMIVREPTLFDGGLDGPLAQVATLARRLAAPLQRNTRSGSRRNISAHYDLGNDFFELMLDPSMTYSSAIFETPEVTLEEAQAAKYDRLCRRIGLTKEHHLLEIVVVVTRQP